MGEVLKGPSFMCMVSSKSFTMHTNLLIESEEFRKDTVQIAYLEERVYRGFLRYKIRSHNTKD